MSSSYREVSSQSWFSRIGQSIKSVPVGLVMFVVAFPLLFWNESRADQTSFLTALFLSLVTIAISWIFVRPLLDIGLLVVALAALGWLISVGVKKKNARAGLPPVPVPA